MRNFTKRVSSMLLLAFIGASFLAAQVPADQAVIVIEDGLANIGLLEKTINEDVDGDGNRINSTRIYELKAGGIYYMQSSILFGSADSNDTTSTLNIIGVMEDGKNMPIVLCQPADGGDQWRNQVHGSLTLKNVYWPATNLTEKSSGLFGLQRSNQKLVLENFVTENMFNGDAFDLRSVKGSVDIYIKNCYFRDMAQLGNSWNFSIFARGDNGEAIDTLWVENTTVNFSGMPFFGKQNPVNFCFFDHNTVMNSTKYPFWMEQFKEAYFTNNMFINANYEGECEATYSTQLPDGVPSGVLNLDTIKNEWWIETAPPTMEEVKWMASNNLNYSSPLLDNYYGGGLNDTYDAPLSYRAWGTVTEDMLPTPVSNVPVPFLGVRTQGLVDAYDNIKADNNHDDDMDPMMVTKGIADQASADEFVKFMRKNYAVPDAVAHDKSLMYYGDALGATIPGGGTEEGGGFEDVSGFAEDFSYTADIKSLIDDQPLGSLAWWPGKVDSYDGMAALEHIKKYYAGTVGIKNVAAKNAASFSIYPNPANTVLNIDGSSEMSSAMFYDVTGRMVMQINLDGEISKSMDISELNNGVYILQVQSISGEFSASKFVKK